MQYKAWSKQENCIFTVIDYDWCTGEMTVEFLDGGSMMDDASEFIIISLGE